MPDRRAAAALAATSLALAAALGGCTAGAGSSPAAEPVLVGVLTDESTATGAAAVQAAQLAVDLVNEQIPELPLPLAAGTGLPGLAGTPLALAVADTAGQPGGAETAIDRLLAEPGLTGVIAVDDPEVIATAGAYADRRQLPLVDAASSAGFLLEVGLDWYFRVTPSDRMLAEAVFALLAAAPAGGGSGVVAVLAPAGGASADLVASLPELSRASGLATGPPIAAGADGTSLRLAETAPDPVLAVAATAGEARQLSQLLAGAGTGRPVAGLGAGFGPEPDRVPVGMVYPAGWSPEFAGRHPLARAVAERYLQRYEAAMSGTAAAAFTATLTLALAVDAARSTDPAAVRAELRRLSIPATQTIMPWNGVRFGPDGQNELAAAVVDQRTTDGSSLVYPPELAATTVTWPAPAGSPEAGP
jgi:branched-chain amino acid transport system substrate-binding protein